MKYQGPYIESVNAAEALIAVNGGGTFRRSGVEVHPTLGYAVGGATNGLIFTVGAVSHEKQVSIIARWLDALETSIQYVGSWINDGKLYIDAVTIVESYIDAFLLGVERGELAIYDYFKMEEVTIKKLA